MEPATPDTALLSVGRVAAHNILFRHTFQILRRRRPMADPSTAAARLQVIGMSRDLARSMPATRRHSDRPGFDRRAHTGLGCFLMRDALRVLRKATEVNIGFRLVRFY